MKIGTKSVLIGAHCFFLHPWFVALAWWKLYGFPKDIRLWVAFFVHDLGYWGKPNMDGAEGELHPYTGANIMHKLFDGYDYGWTLGGRNHFDQPELNGYYYNGKMKKGKNGLQTWFGVQRRRREWFNFTLYHSRYLAKKQNAQYSKLCVADKFSITLTPWWLYLPMVNLTGEIKEYMRNAITRSNNHEKLNEVEKAGLTSGHQKDWYMQLQAYMRRWVAEHKEIKEDKWTGSRAA